MGAIRVVKAFGQERREQKRLFRCCATGHPGANPGDVAESEFSLLMGITVAGGTATVLFIGAEAVRAGQLTTGELVLVMALFCPTLRTHSDDGEADRCAARFPCQRGTNISVLDENPLFWKHPMQSPLHARGIFV